MKDLERRISELQDIDTDVPGQRRFNLVMGALIVINTVVVALETDWGLDSGGKIEDKIGWVIVDTLFIMIFLFEVLVRVYWERSNWWRSPWNWVDVVILLIAIVDIWVLTLLNGDLGNLHILVTFRIVRLIRLVRLVKLVRLLRGLYVILMAFWHAMQTMSFLVAIMVFGLMVYSIFATNIIGRNSALQHIRINNDTVKQRFGSVSRSMYSLFELMTLEGWEQVARPIVEEEPVLFLFIVSFIMIFTFGMLNMIVALVIDKTLHHTRLMGEHEQAEEREQMAFELTRIHAIFSQGVRDGMITLEEFEASLRESSCVRNIFDRMGVPLKDARELYTVLDWDKSGELTIEEFLEGLAKLQDGTPSAWDSLATHSAVRSIRNTVLDMQASMARLSMKHEESLALLRQQGEQISRIEARLREKAAY